MTGNTTEGVTWLTRRLRARTRGTNTNGKHEIAHVQTDNIIIIIINVVFSSGFETFEIL